VCFSKILIGIVTAWRYDWQLFDTGPNHSALDITV